MRRADREEALVTYQIKNGMRIDSTGCHAWLDGVEVTCAEYRESMRWRSCDWIYQELMEGRCTNCRSTECHCCVGCGQPDADIIGSHGYHCV